MSKVHNAVAEILFGADTATVLDASFSATDLENVAIVLSSEGADSEAEECYMLAELVFAIDALVLPVVSAPKGWDSVG